MGKLQPYKVVYDKTEIFFVDRAFKSAFEQAQDFIRRNKERHPDMKLFYRNIHSKYNFGWKRMG